MTRRRMIAAGLLLGIAIAAIVGLRRTRKSAHRVVRTAVGYRLGLVAVDTTRRAISFPARVVRDTGSVLTLVVLTGYPWLEQQAALSSEAHLLDLQHAFALLDWALWDSLWRGLDPGQQARLEIDGRSAEQFVEGCRISSPALPSLIFLGCPEFDPLVLEDEAAANCTNCPVYDEERRFITQALRRRTSDLQLKPVLRLGSEVNIVLRLPPAAAQ